MGRVQGAAGKPPGPACPAATSLRNRNRNGNGELSQADAVENSVTTDCRSRTFRRQVFGRGKSSHTGGPSSGDRGGSHSRATRPTAPTPRGIGQARGQRTTLVARRAAEGRASAVLALLGDGRKQRLTVDLNKGSNVYVSNADICGETTQVITRESRFPKKQREKLTPPGRGTEREAREGAEEGSAAAPGSAGGAGPAGLGGTRTCCVPSGRDLPRQGGTCGHPTGRAARLCDAGYSG